MTSTAPPQETLHLTISSTDSGKKAQIFKLNNYLIIGSIEKQTTRNSLKKKFWEIFFHFLIDLA